jgi:Fe-S cluster assembly protein SufD
VTTATAVSAPAAYRAAFERLSDSRGAEPAFLAGRRRQAFETFEAEGFPHPRMEEWRATDVSAVAEQEFTPAAPGQNGFKDQRLADFTYDGLDRLVFVNGFLSRPLSQVSALAAGVVVGGLEEGLAASAPVLEAHLARHAPTVGHPFAALNTAFHADVALVRVGAGVRLDRPIHVVFVSTGAAAATVAYPRVLVVAERDSSATIVESHVATGGGGYLSCGVTEIVAADNAIVRHYKIQKEHVDAYHFHALAIHQAAHTDVASHSISIGGGLVRHDVRALLDGEGGHCTLNGLYMVRGTQFVDTHMFVEHAAPHCTSYELYKGILEERSRAVFNGRIYVHRAAQKTDAVQSNRNLLLSREALVNSNPQLEIFADDVRCTHGSTIGQLDPDAVFYLRSRGISEAAARSLLVYAFASDIVDRITVPAVRTDMEELLFARLPSGQVVRQAI